MSIASLMLHRGEVWRDASGMGQYNEPTVNWSRVTNPTSNNAEPYILNLHLEDRGPGEQSAGRKKWVLRKDAVVAQRDVLNIVSGPEAPSRWMILSVNFPRAHHYELVTEPCQVVLPGDA